ncbi:hypothetical protein ACH5RR_004345 [Cinchona calisaya]|uniref:Uncharacterized protein n=1 Tax=Cinchona calisaya TaxID=153742 RepID=A0ABD3AXE1_9GENT
MTETKKVTAREHHRRLQSPPPTMAIFSFSEMINLLNVLQKNRFNPKFYIAAASNNMSLQNRYFAIGMEIEEMALREQKIQNS